MTQVDFYVLPSAGEPGRRLFACKLTEKVYRLDKRVHIATDDDRAAREMDELLWTFRDGSFVPHQLADGSAVEAPVTIGPAPPAGLRPDLVINLGDDVPAAIEGIERIAEIVSDDDDARQQSRRRYARYRELGHTLKAHNL